MDVAEKYQLIARSLRDLADSPAEKRRRGNALALAAFFDRLAQDAGQQRGEEIEIHSLFGSGRLRLNS
jgi:hypothetical protein